MTDTKQLDIAIKIATKAHFGQVDKAGQPYILHCLKVMFSGKTIQEKICGVLHDTVEDTSLTLDDIEKAGFSKEIIETVKCLTKLPKEKYQDYLIRVSTNRTAIKVKLNDLNDNLDIKRLKKIEISDVERVNKYLMAYQFLIKSLNS